MGNEGGRPSCVRLRFIVWSFNTRVRLLNDGEKVVQLKETEKKISMQEIKKQTSFFVNKWNENQESSLPKVLLGTEKEKL